MIKKIATVLMVIMALLITALITSPASAGTGPPPLPVPVVAAEAMPDIPTLQPVAYAKGYHIRNHPDSVNEVFIYSEVGCGGSENVLYRGDNAVSSGWDSFGMWSDRQYFVVKVYRGSDGAHLATRTYEWWECVRAYPTNSYLVVVKWK